MRGFGAKLALLVALPACNQLLGISNPVAGDATEPDGPRPDGPDMDGPPPDAPPACTTATAFGNEITSAVGGGTGVALVIGRYDAGTVNDVAVAVGTDTVTLLGDNAGNFAVQQTLAEAAINVITDDFHTIGIRDDLLMLTAGGVACREHSESVIGQFSAAAVPLDGPFANATQMFKGEFGGASIANPEPVIHDDTGNIVFTLNSGTACSFTRIATVVGGGGDRIVFVGQIDKAGEHDIVMVDAAGNVKLALSDGGDGTFDPITTIGSGATGLGVGFGNFDDDTFLDMIVATSAGGEVYLQNSASPGVFTKQTGTFPGVISTEPLLVGDLNDDNLDDVLTPTAAVLQCPTTHVFTQVEPLVATRPAILGDVNGDTKLDLLRLSGTDLLVRLQP